MPENIKKYYLLIIASLGGLIAGTAIGTDFLPGLNQELITKFLGEAASNQITQTGFFFTMAAWLHSGRVKKEIKANFASLTEAINNVAVSLREDLKSQSEIIGKHSGLLDNLNSRVQYVESNINLNKGK